MEITASTMRCGTGEIVCERRDGMGTTGQTVGRDTVGKGADSGTGNSRDGNKTPYVGMVNGGDRNQQGSDGLGTRGLENEPKLGFPFSRAVSFPSRPHFPVPTFTVPLIRRYG